MRVCLFNLIYPKMQLSMGWKVLSSDRKKKKKIFLISLKKKILTGDRIGKQWIFLVSFAVHLIWKTVFPCPYLISKFKSYCIWTNTGKISSLICSNREHSLWYNSIWQREWHQFKISKFKQWMKELMAKKLKYIRKWECNSLSFTRIIFLTTWMPGVRGL